MQTFSFEQTWKQLRTDPQDAAAVARIVMHAKHSLIRNALMHLSENSRLRWEVRTSSEWLIIFLRVEPECAERPSLVWPVATP